MGQSPSSNTYNQDGEGLPFYQGNADFGKENPVPRVWCSDPKRTADKGDVLVSVRAPIGAVNIANDRCCIGRGVAAIRPNKQLISTSFLKHQLLASCKKLEAMGTGSTFKAVGKKALSDFPIFIYSEDGQTVIEGQLDWALEQLEHAKREVAELDSLVKSRFVEMFGDRGGHGSFTCKLSEVAEISSGITKGRKTRETELVAVPYLATANVQAGRLDLSSVKTINATPSEIERFKLLEGDILMTEGGDPDKVGRGTIARNLPKNCIHQNHVFRVRLNAQTISPDYFELFLQSPDCRKYFFRSSKQTTGIATINKTQLNNLPVLVPPAEEQQKFATFAAEADKSRFAS